jgi:hypothetical protein
LVALLRLGDQPAHLAVAPQQAVFTLHALDLLDEAFHRGLVTAQQGEIKQDQARTQIAFVLLDH